MQLSPASLEHGAVASSPHTTRTFWSVRDGPDDAVSTSSATLWRLSQTVDFFTPRSTTRTLRHIESTTALRDLYAMGGIPISALAFLELSRQRRP